MNLLQLREAVQVLQRDLIYHRHELVRVRPDFEARIGRFLSPARPFDVAHLASNAAFQMDSGGNITFNAEAFTTFHGPIIDAERAGRISAAVAEVSRLMAIEQLVVHELSHVGIGLVHFEDVQFFKSMVGVDALGEVDVIADATAAHICALLELRRSQETRPLAAANRLLAQLFLMGSYAFPAFRSPADKLHKRRRFLGIAMQAARVNAYIEKQQLPDITAGEFPIETPIYPYFNSDGEILICAFNPDRVLWGRKASVDGTLLGVTLDELDSAPFAVSVKRAGSLLGQVGNLLAPFSYEANTVLMGAKA